MLLKFLSDNIVFVIAIILLVLFMTWLIFCLCKFNLIKRISNVTDLPDDISGISLSGIVTSVIDGDGFRFYHVPMFRSSEHAAEDRKLIIRLAGIDAPESASPGMPAQPFSKEAKEHLSHLVLGKNVRLKLIKIDRYGRLLAICIVKKCLIWPVNVNLEMVKVGLACVYKGSDAQYNGMLNDFKRAEANANSKKLGMWKQNHYVSPMDHKRKWRKDKKKITHVV